MKITEVVSELDMELQESQNARDKRVEELWRRLNPTPEGALDLKGLQKGLRRIDHPMKNADDLLQQIMNRIDKSGHGKIEYQAFREFVEQAERHLWFLFRSIDRDQNGRLDKSEFQAAFHKAGLAVPSKRLAGFFSEIDCNQDGFISFDEWRNFLLFVPTAQGKSPLEAAFSYYSSIVTLNAEGDSMVSEETLEGLGTSGFLLQSLFGSILKIARSNALDQPPPQSASLPAGEDSLPSVSEFRPDTSNDYYEDATGSSSIGGYSYDHRNSDTSQMAILRAIERGVRRMLEELGEDQPLDPHYFDPRGPSQEESQTSKSRLTQYLPEPGYFVAGALAGGISRTATAPLDRLKVYLLVNTTSPAGAVTDAAKMGQPVRALKKVGAPFTDAVKNLYKQGGLRNFFAGNGLNVVKIMPETAIKFGSYEFTKRTLANLEGHGDPGNINPYSKFAAGGLAGMTAQFCVYPLDTLKFRLQCETTQGGKTGRALMLDTATKMWTQGGVRSAYRGITMGLVGMFPYSAIDMGTFEFLKNTYSDYKARYYGIHEDDAAPGNVATGIIGATSGAFGATVVYPLNVLRTRLQTQGTAMHPPTYTGIWDVAAKTIRNEGPSGLYKGLTPNLLKVAPALSITWVVYENSKRLLELS